MFKYRYDYDTDSFVKDGVRTEILVPTLVLVILAVFAIIF